MKGRTTTRRRNVGVDIGTAVKTKLKASKLTVVWFAEQLGCSRTNVYKIFNKHSIDTEELFKISRILDFDFFKLYSDKLFNKME